MNNQNAIEANEITKKFRVYYDKGRTIKEKILFKNRNKYEDRYVLQGISFTVKKGEAVGLIGENGCGKSTTLKLLTKIMYPDSGSIDIQGRISSLLELGAGFHPDMSGRENIYTNASIFGLSKKEIDQRLQDIIAFSELGEYLDNPVRTYSSGMYMRLAFSVAINVNADVLLIDEILAVGDANFQAKCFNKLRELKASGMTIIIVSHDSSVIESFCDKAIWLNEGKIESIGKSSFVVDDYLNYMNNKKIQSLQELERIELDEIEEFKEDALNTDNQQESLNDFVEDKDMIDINKNHFGLGYILIKKAYFLNYNGIMTKTLKAGNKYDIVIEYVIKKPLDEYVFGMGFYDLDGKCIVGCNTQLDRICVPHNKMSGNIIYRIEDLTLLTGKYVLNVAIVDKNGTPLDFYRDYCHFDVISDDRCIGLVSIKHKWLTE